MYPARVIITKGIQEVQQGTESGELEGSRLAVEPGLTKCQQGQGLGSRE